MGTVGSRKRSFLFLQGCGSLFFVRLGAALAELGHRVHRINFCGGDELFWPDLPASSFTEPQDGFAAAFEAHLDRGAVTDVLLLGDCRPLHRTAIAIADRRGVRVQVIEQGYLRPNWITMEEGGINGHSRLPRDPGWYLDRAAGVPDYGSGVPVGDGMRARIVDDFRYQFATLTSSKYPHYETHRPYPILTEYRSWITRLAGLPLRRRQADRLAAFLIENRRRYFFFALQLDSDTQVRVHSPFGGMVPALEAVIASFAAHAPGDALLIIKNHPLDNGMIAYRRRIRRQAEAFGVGGRVLFIDGGPLDALLRHALGVVVVNSTVGMAALAHGRPTIALGTAVYDLPGLTFQDGIDAFWTMAAPPDPRLFKAFRNGLIHLTQLNGNLYTDGGQRLAVAGAVRRLCGVPGTAPPLSPAAAGGGG